MIMLINKAIDNSGICDTIEMDPIISIDLQVKIFDFKTKLRIISSGNSKTLSKEQKSDSWQDHKILSAVDWLFWI